MVENRHKVLDFHKVVTSRGSVASMAARTWSPPAVATAAPCGEASSDPCRFPAHPSHSLPQYCPASLENLNAMDYARYLRLIS